MHKKTHTTLYIEKDLLKTAQKKCIDASISLTAIMAELLSFWVKDENYHRAQSASPQGMKAVVVPEKLAPAVERFVKFLQEPQSDDFMAEFKAMILKRIGVRVEENDKEGPSASHAERMRGG